MYESIRIFGFHVDYGYYLDDAGEVMFTFINNRRRELGVLNNDALAYYLREIIRERFFEEKARAEGKAIEYHKGYWGRTPF